MDTRQFIIALVCVATAAYLAINGKGETAGTFLAIISPSAIQVAGAAKGRRTAPATDVPTAMADEVQP